MEEHSAELKMGTIGEIKLNDIEIEWKIPNFSSLSNEHSVAYNSSTFSYNNESWYLAICPNGNDKTSTGYVSLFLYKKASASSIKVEYTLGLKAVSGQKDSKRHVEHTFPTLLQGWGYHKHLLRSHLSEKEVQLLPGDVLTVFCSMKCPTSFATQVKGASSEKCSLCAKVVDADNLKTHQRKDKLIKCPDCSAVFTLQNLCDHECQSQEASCESINESSDNEVEKCFCCQESLGNTVISLDEDCANRLIKCPDCLDVISLQNWLQGHECQTEKTEDDTSLSEDLKKVLLDGCNHDLILKVGDEEFKAHQDILGARSEVFKRMLKSDMTEKNSGVIDIPDCDPDAMKVFLSYIYCGKVENLHQSNAIGLYYIADKYEMEILKEKCSDLIKKSASSINICEVIQLALNHSDSSLLDFATEFFLKNVLEILRTVEWQRFMKNNVTVANELMIKSHEKKK